MSLAHPADSDFTSPHRLAYRGPQLPGWAGEDAPVRVARPADSDFSALTPPSPALLSAGCSSPDGHRVSGRLGSVWPAGTPRPIVDRLNMELVKILKDPKILERLVNDGPIAIGNTPEEFTAFIKSEQAKWSQVIKAADIKIE